MEKNNYELIDSGDGRKLERFGSALLARPCSQAVWKKKLKASQWEAADAVFVRESDTKWQFDKRLEESWVIEVSGVKFKISPTDFGHLGIFPEQKPFWEWMTQAIKAENQKRQEPLQVLNLFAYSGGSTLAAAKGGAHVCHLDASKGMVAWARENAALNHLEHAPIRWIIDDAIKFLNREVKRGKFYDAIILDPPSFGRGSKGEIFKIDNEIQQLLGLCRALLSKKPFFILFSCHTPGYTPLVMHHLLTQAMDGLQGVIDTGEMVLSGSQGVFEIPSGTFGRWQHG